MSASTTINVRQWKRYPEYKSVMLDWLQQVPEHWPVLRLKDSVRKCVNGVWGDESNGSEDDVVCIRVADFDRVTFRVPDIEFTRRAIPQHQRVSRNISKGDLLLEKSGGGDGQPVGAVVLFGLDIPAVCSNFIARIQLNPGFDPAFLCYLHASLYSGRINVRSIKQSIGIQNLDAGSYFNEAVPYAPLDEQRRIVAFLDRETARIDALIAKKERLIELLQEKRTALISHAVTKGLDPTVPMKDSGVAWLGKIPAHWEIERAKFLFRQTRLPVRDGDGVVTAFRDGQVTLRQNRRTEGFTFAILELGYQGIRTGQLVLHSMDAFAGAIGVSESDGKCSPEYIVCDPLMDELVPDFYAPCLREMSRQGFIEVSCKAVRERAPRIRFSTFGEMWLPVPPRSEQFTIASHIKHSRLRYEEHIRTLRKSVTLLREYRTALISAAVTGKIDVREEVA